MNDEHFRKLEAMYNAAPVNQSLSPAIRVTRGRAEFSLCVDDQMFHAAHAVHGSVYFKALDDAAFFAANSIVSEFFLLTSSFNIQFLRPVTVGTVTSIGVLKNESRRVIVADAELFDDGGRLLARGSGLFMKSEIPLTRAISYQSSTE